MRRLLLATAGVLLWVSPAVRADLVRWDADWSVGPHVLTSGQTRVFLADPVTEHGRGPGTTNVIADYLWVFSSAPGSRPDHFVNKAYKLTLKLMDRTARLSGTVSWTGLLSGTVSRDHMRFVNRLTSPRLQSLHLGQYWYNVTLGPFVAPNPFDLGMLKAQVSVHHNPEPGGLVLAGLGVAGLGLFWWRRRARAAAALKAR
jgi:hypothetical protein